MLVTVMVPRILSQGASGDAAHRGQQVIQAREAERAREPFRSEFARGARTISRQARRMSVSAEHSAAGQATRGFRRCTGPRWARPGSKASTESIPQSAVTLRIRTGKLGWPARTWPQLAMLAARPAR
jgi:hypothetical protein